MATGSSSARAPAAAEHDLLREATRGFLARHEPLSRVRAGLETQRVLDRDRWRAAAAMGWIAAVLPGEEDATLADAVVIAEELGRGLYTGPFLGSGVVARLLAAAGGPAARHVAQLVDGTTTAAWCVDARANAWHAPAVTATRERDGWTVDGAASLVVDADVADLLLVTAVASGELVSVLVEAQAPGVTVDVQPGLDLTRRVARVELTGVRPPDDVLAGEGQEHERHLAEAADIAAVLVAADAVGCAERLMERTVDYALQRVAFGRVIASYQAVKHRCADMLCAVEGSRLLVQEAARSLDRPGPRTRAAVRAAKAFAGEQCAAVAGESLQIHGGIGFTWEHDLHLYLRRVKADEMLYGTPAEHYAELGAGLAAASS